MDVKKYSLMFGIALFSILLVACGNNEGGSSANGNDSAETSGSNETFNFLVGSWVPAAHPSNTQAFEPWIEQVEEETDGAVTFDLQAGSVLGQSDQVITDVSGGVYDIGLAVGQFYPNTSLFKMTILDLPFALSNADDHMHASKVANRYMDEFVAQSLEDELGMKLIGSYLVDATVFLSPEPIRTVADMERKRTYLQASSWEKIITEWGATPVSMAVEDVYTALDRGTLDVGVYALAGMYSQKLHETAPYITYLPTSNIAGAIIMNLDTFNALPEELQENFTGDFKTELTELNNLAYAEQQQLSLEAIEEEIQGRGEVIYPEDEAVGEFMAPAKEVWESWIDTANENGYDGEALMEGFLNIMEEEGIEPPFEM